MWFLITLTCIILLVIILLVIPISFVFNVDSKRQPRLKLSFVWLFGLVNWPLKSTPKKKPVKKKKEPKKKGRGLKMWGILRSPGLVRQFLRLIKRILSCIKLRDFNIDLRFGLSNPADTGYIFGVVQPISVFLPAKYSVTIKPEFFEPVFEGCSTGTLTFRPICIVAHVINSLFSLPALRLYWGLITGKWKKKK